MGYQMGAANNQYMGHGAEGCIQIDDKPDFTADMIEEMLEEADGEIAMFSDGEDDVYVVEFPGRPQEVYTEKALRRSLKQYMAPTEAAAAPAS